MSEFERAALVSETKFRDFLRHCDLPGFLIAPEISEFAQLLVAEELDGKESWGDVRIPGDAIRHARGMVLGMQGPDGAVEIYALDERDDRPDGDPESIVYELRSDGMLHLGNFTPGGVAFIDERLKGKQTAEQETETAFIIATMAFVLSLINQPHTVRRDPLLSRQQRRAAQRGGAKAADAWHRVSWDIGADTVAKVSRDPNFHKVPLHWRRGHFRRAEQHYKGALRRLDAIRPEDRDLWWQWIDGHWVGHPAFGIKRSIHSPRLTAERLARRRAA